MKKLLILVLSYIFVLNNFANALKVRGVAPERASLYDENKSFTCLDGSSVIPFSQVNDDYCDCRDGSDEPGTSACLNGSFACENLGYIVQYIPSSRVNDGICDCCDGSDEYNGKVNCENTCNELAAKMKEEQEKLKKLKEEGFAKKKELIEASNELKKTLQNKIQDLEAKKQSAESERAALEEKKKQTEQLAKEAKDKHDAIVQEKLREQEKIELSKKIKALFDLIDLDKNGLIKPEELLVYQELDILFDNDGTFTIEESIRLIDQNDGVDLILFESVYYPKISPHINEKKEEEPPATPATGSDETPQPGEENEEVLEASEDGHDEHEEVTGGEQASKVPSSQDLNYDADTQALIDESNEARKRYDESDRNYRDIESEINDARRKLELDTGVSGEFAAMVDQCYEYEDREYIYKLCPFEKTVQKSKSNSAETIIGNWKSWGADGPDKYHSMKFDNGLACWNGPQRSTNVIVSCGIENKIISVSEPNRCEYEMKFETPAVCDEFGVPTHIPALHEHDDL